MIYLDTSVLAKRYYREPDSDRFRGLSELPGEVATTSLSYVEFFSGLNRKLRLKEIEVPRYEGAAEEFERDWVHFNVLPLSARILRQARQVIERHALPAGDAIQLASALSLAASLPTEFASADERLNQAARREGLKVL